ncbi:protein of unknown function DUF1084 [Cynara cardunculus var. scolymus]|uniref:THH1/TOM1/TOM3 domain-containing protein n=1 Tax=Cynara cardunculus var. scolymus TaxID=59895 RepID=A0A118JYP1_CYNCS|nr:protein of unknown function DUF1084 [Cynara cardunculus var. scolymus]
MTRVPLGIPSSLSSMKMIDRWSSSDWWEEINESRYWQDGIFFALCASYALVSAIALIQLIRIELRVPEYGWTTQKVFHLMNFVVNGVRAVVFGFHLQVFSLHPKAKNLPTDKLRIVYASVNAGVYLIQYGAIPRKDICCSCIAYGSRRLPALWRKVGSVTGICFTCFLVRCFVDVLSAFDSKASLDVLDHPVLNLIFYMLVEILPSALVLYILRKLPPKRVSAQYHPIH